MLVDAWERSTGSNNRFNLAVKKDSSYRIELSFRQSQGDATVKLQAGNYVRTDFTSLADRIRDADAIVFVGGISPQLEGEEMPVTVPGFKGGDRTSIMLPVVQTDLMKALKKTGKPIVFVMMTGSAIAIPWESENIPGIVNAWYGGQSAGTAVADVLFGDYNPAGRLPVTFYKNDKDLRGFGDYAMEGRTYRYFSGDPLYPFGYGLSYSTFRYSDLKAPSTLGKNKKLTISVSVKNTGPLAGEEVVQLYVAHQYNKGRKPIRTLRGFQRIALKPGETRIINFMLSAEQLSLVREEDGKFFQPDDMVTISVGGGQPGLNVKTSSNVVSKSIIIR